MMNASLYDIAASAQTGRPSLAVLPQATLAAPLQAKLDALRLHLQELQSVVVAFSGGVDSALVLKVAVDVLGRGRVLAVTARSPSVPAAELAGVSPLAAEIGAAHEFVETREFEDPQYLANPTNRCYFCKTELYSLLTPLAAERGFAAVVNGVNADDLGDYRPGLQAAGEHRVHMPLADAGLTKAELRQIAAWLGLPVHDKPASPCLSSRVQYGEAITPAKLRQIDAAETFLRERGFRECRVRHHGSLARIEVPADQIERLMDEALRTAVDRRLRELGYQYVSVDLRGLRSGSMNEVLLGTGLLRAAGHGTDRPAAFAAPAAASAMLPAGAATTAAEPPRRVPNRSTEGN